MAGTCVWGSVCVGSVCVCGGGGGQVMSSPMVPACLIRCTCLLTSPPLCQLGVLTPVLRCLFAVLPSILLLIMYPPTPGREQGLRIVEVPASEVHNLVDIARGCARYPRVHFILVVDHLELPLRGPGSADLMGALAAAGGCSERGGVGGVLRSVGGQSQTCDKCRNLCPHIFCL